MWVETEDGAYLNLNHFTLVGDENDDAPDRWKIIAQMGGDIGERWTLVDGLDCAMLELLNAKFKNALKTEQSFYSFADDFERFHK